MNLSFGSAPVSEDFNLYVASDPVVNCRCKSRESVSITVFGSEDLLDVVCAKLFEQSAGLG